MPTWNPDLYLRFSEERTQPCRDLAAGIAIEAPNRVIDLGCSPGNSTQVLAARWPDAEIIGLDSSSEMIEAAGKNDPARTWIRGDIASWTTDRPLDIVFSNAALQWVPDHQSLYPRLLQQVVPGGAFAMQVPGNMHAPAHELMRELAASSAWSSSFPPGSLREWRVLELPSYYDVLAPHASRIDAWETEYLLILPSVEAIVDWYKGTGLRPFLDVLPTEGDKTRFAADYLELLRPAYPARPDGRVLFPFRRLFLVAYR